MKSKTVDSTTPIPDGRSEPFREHTRAPLEAPVRLKFDTLDQMQTGYTANVSRGGMFVHVADARPVGTLLKFELDLNSSRPPISGFGEIVWIRLKQRELQHPPGMGIQFRHLDVESLAALEKAIGKALAEAGHTHGSVEAPGDTDRNSRLLREIEEALARCEDLGPALERDE
jgi:uncharacterized protein (TIGR02266 family)